MIRTRHRSHPARPRASSIMAEAKQVTFRCESCGKIHTWKPRIAGKKAKCPCGHIMTVPAGRVGDAPRDESAPLDLNEELDESADPAPSPRPAGAGASAWKWWYFVVAGAL